MVEPEKQDAPFLDRMAHLQEKDARLTRLIGCVTAMLFLLACSTLSTFGIAVIQFLR